MGEGGGTGVTVGGGGGGAGGTELGVDEGGVVKVMPSPWGGAAEDANGDSKVSMTGGDRSVVMGMKVEVGDGVTCWVANMAVAPATGLMVAATAAPSSAVMAALAALAVMAALGDGAVADILDNDLWQGKYFFEITNNATPMTNHVVVCVTLSTFFVSFHINSTFKK